MGNTKKKRSPDTVSLFGRGDESTTSPRASI